MQNFSCNDTPDMVNQALVSVLEDGTIRSISTYFYRLFNDDLTNKNIFDLGATENDVKKLHKVVSCSEPDYDENIIKPAIIHLKTVNGIEAFNVVGTVVTTEGVNYRALIISSISDVDLINTIKLHADRMEITSHINSQLSHEIRSPLSSFSLNLAYLLDKFEYFKDKCIHQGCQLYQELPEYIKVTTEMQSQVRYVEEILNNLSEYARLSSVTLVPIDFGETVLATLKLMRVASVLKALDPEQFIINIESLMHVFIKGNTVWISQILWNLCVNAYEAIGSEGKIYVLGKSTENFVYLRICNTGKIDEGVIDKIFDPYITTKSNSSHRGLGLSIVKNLVLKSRGFVWAYNYFCEVTKTDMVVMNIRFPRVENTDPLNIKVSDEDNLNSHELYSVYC